MPRFRVSGLAEADLDTTDSIRLNFSQNHPAAVEAVRRIGQLVERYRKG